MKEYFSSKNQIGLPRIPFEGSLDLTYRCNNKCRHCWINTPLNSSLKKNELNFDKIKTIVTDARSMGCRTWYISGGEPMIRPDFCEIFTLITDKSLGYTLNTNGTFITPKIAKLLKKKGQKLISIYGADEKIFDHITRTKGSFNAAMRGISYLKESGVGFIIQIVPMKDNFHQLNKMISLAESLSPHWRYGASWLYLRADGSADRNREILEQRLSPSQVLEIDPPPFYESENCNEDPGGSCSSPQFFTGILSRCIDEGSSFHIDPYGGMSFCQFVKDPAIRVDLKKYLFKEAWEEVIPGFSKNLGKRYLEWKNGDGNQPNNDNGCCPVYSYLENRDYYSDVNYLSEIEALKVKEKERLTKAHTKFFRIGGVTIRVESDIPMAADTFEKRFHKFEVDGPGEDNILIRNHFSIPNIDLKKLGKEIYKASPWLVYEKSGTFTYITMLDDEVAVEPPQVGVFKNNYSRNIIYNNEVRADLFRKGNFPTLSLSPSDQLLLAQVFAHRDACYFHSSGIIYKGSGHLFMGHSGAGKSTITTYLSREAEILCDDRNIVRKEENGFRLFGSWSHGDLSEVSANSAPLKGIYFLVQSDINRIEPITDKKIITSKLLAFLIKPLQLPEWWQKSLDTIEKIVRDIPCNFLHFRRDNNVKKILEELE